MAKERFTVLVGFDHKTARAEVGDIIDWLTPETAEYLLSEGIIVNAPEVKSPKAKAGS